MEQLNFRAAGILTHVRQRKWNDDCRGWGSRWMRWKWGLEIRGGRVGGGGTGKLGCRWAKGAGSTKGCRGIKV